MFILVTSVSAGAAYLMGLLLRVKPAHRYDLLQFIYIRYLT